MSNDDRFSRTRPQSSCVVQAAQLQRPEVHVPDPVVDFLQPDVLADADDQHVHPATIPPDPPGRAKSRREHAISTIDPWRAIRWNRWLVFSLPLLPGLGVILGTWLFPTVDPQELLT